MDKFEKFQFETLKKFALHNDWFDRLILEFNWTEEQSEIFEDVCNKYGDMDPPNYTYSDFENELKDRVKIGYQSIKIVIQTFHNYHVYDDIVFNCLKSIRESKTPFQYMPSEFKPAEKELFGENI